MIQIRIDLDFILIFVMVAVSILAAIYILFDVNYFLVSGAILAWGKLHKRKIRVDQSTEFYGLCTTNDLDGYFNHMNNARYMRDLDFARLHFMERTGLYEAIQAANGSCLQSASNIRYRRKIPLFTFYKVTSKVLYWNEKDMYLEHHFITLNDGFIRAVVLSKQGIIGMDVLKTMNKLLDKDESYKPELPSELEDWIQLLAKSSARLRKKDQYLMT